jgi:predicted NUDIX family NTP pyrophosphohydrolase
MISNNRKKKKESAGILIYKKENNFMKYFLVHPGGPFWKNKNEGAWSIPKGEVEDNEDKLVTAIREVYEETGIKVADQLIDLGSIKQKSGKVVYAWAFEGEFDGELKCTSTCEIEYPPKSGKKIQILEIDKAGMFTKDQCKKLINNAQYEFIERLENLLNN